MCVENVERFWEYKSCFKFLQICKNNPATELPRIDSLCYSKSPVLFRLPPTPPHTWHVQVGSECCIPPLCDFFFFFFLTVWQRGGELRQVLHAYPTPAHAARRAGDNQHRPGRVRRLLLHQPSVRSPVARQQRMRRRRRMVESLTKIPAHCRLPKPTVDEIRLEPRVPQLIPMCWCSS